MEMKITSETVNGLQIFKIGDFPFSTLAEAEEFVEWFSWLLRRRRELTEAAEVWAGRQRLEEQNCSGVMLHDLMSGLAYLSFALAAAGAVEQMHLAMIRQVTKRLEKVVQASEGAKVMTKGDVAVIMGDVWAKANLGTSLKDKLRTAGEPAPLEWVEMARAKQAKQKKTPSPGM